MGLAWSKTAADGSDRSFVSQIIDPVGACVQPADLSPWKEEEFETPAAAPAEPASAQA